MRGFDDDKFENRIHKIEDNLFSHEPHLAQLLQLDAIGADVLSQEKEKILRSQLEMEIFRQLQMQRQDIPARYPLPHLPNIAGYRGIINRSHSNSTSYPGNSTSQSSSQGGSVGISSSGSGSGSHGSVEGSPSTGNNQRRRTTFPRTQQFGKLKIF